MVDLPRLPPPRLSPQSLSGYSTNTVVCGSPGVLSHQDGGGVGLEGGGGGATEEQSLQWDTDTSRV